jgi:hypothetical protein
VLVCELRHGNVVPKAFIFKQMPGQSDLSLRIVVQFIAGCAGTPSQYRLIAYSSMRTFPALNFADTAELMQRPEAAGIPEDLRPQLDEPTPKETTIIHSANLVLKEAQLRILGLLT